jgi:XTP/dITP diphosphohydrolase
VCVSTRNPHKLAELRALMAPHALEVVSAAELGVPEVDETGLTFAANALLKAAAAFEATGLWSLADDSGLIVDALDGAPGVYSARFAGPGATDADNNRLLIERLAEVADADRTARFTARSRWSSRVPTPRRSRARPAPLRISLPELPISRSRAQWPAGSSARPGAAPASATIPTFFTRRAASSFAELSAEAKNSVSHRARAFAKLSHTLASLTATAARTETAS